jgi:hypothetical protein
MDILVFLSSLVDRIESGIGRMVIPKQSQYRTLCVLRQPSGVAGRRRAAQAVATLAEPGPTLVRERGRP